MAEMIRSEVFDEVKDGEYFSIMADETEVVQRKNRFLSYAVTFTMVLVRGRAVGLLVRGIWI